MKHVVIVCAILIVSFFLHPKISRAESNNIVYLSSISNEEFADIDLSNIKEVKLSSFYVNSSCEILFGESSAESSFAEFIIKAQELKKNHIQLKVSMVIGGKDVFSNCLSDQKKSSILVGSIANKLLETNFDGVSINWDVPKSYKDKNYFINFLKALKEKINYLESDNKSYLLSLSIFSYRNSAQYIDLKNSMEYLNYIEIKPYLQDDILPKKTFHLSNLFASENDIWSIDKMVKYLETRGVPSSKIVLQIPSFGLLVKNVEPMGDGLYNKINSENISNISIISNVKIKRYYLPNSNYMLFKSVEANSSYLFNVNSGFFISFLEDDEIENIINYSFQKNLYGTTILY